MERSLITLKCSLFLFCFVTLFCLCTQHHVKFCFFASTSIFFQSAGLLLFCLNNVVHSHYHWYQALWSWVMAYKPLSYWKFKYRLLPVELFASTDCINQRFSAILKTCVWHFFLLMVDDYRLGFFYPFSYVMCWDNQKNEDIFASVNDPMHICYIWFRVYKTGGTNYFVVLSREVWVIALVFMFSVWSSAIMLILTLIKDNTLPPSHVCMIARVCLHLPVCLTDSSAASCCTFCSLPPPTQ